MSANNEQVGGTHYKDMAIQPWDAMRAWMTPEAFRGFLLGNVIKYAARHQAKGGLEDLRKASHYLDKLMEVVEAGRAEGAKVLSEAIDTMDKVLNPVADWPGPDWSQAPEWAMWWTKDDESCTWWSSAPQSGRHHWETNGPDFTYVTAPLFGYTGDWRDSLRKRPT